MPGFDGTGPVGAVPMTGRGMGLGRRLSGFGRVRGDRRGRRRWFWQ